MNRKPAVQTVTETNPDLIPQINPENKREKLVCLSEKGKEAANSLKDIMDQWEKIIFAGITAQEERALERIMCKIVGNVREYERNIGREKL